MYIIYISIEQKCTKYFRQFGDYIFAGIIGIGVLIVLYLHCKMNQMNHACVFEINQDLGLG